MAREPVFTDYELRQFLHYLRFRSTDRYDGDETDAYYIAKKVRDAVEERMREVLFEGSEPSDAQTRSV